MAHNYIPVPLIYDKEELLALLPDPNVTGRMSDNRCSADTHLKIAKHLKLEDSMRYTLDFKVSPNVDGYIHVDFPVMVALLLPLYGENLEMRWYEPIDDKPVKTFHTPAPSDGLSTWTTDNEVRLVERALCTGPLLIRTHSWHSLNNLSNNYARLLSIRFHAYMSYETMIRKMIN